MFGFTEPTVVERCSSLDSSSFDCIVYIGNSIEDIHGLEVISKALKSFADVDKSALESVFIVPSSLPSKKIVFSSVGSLKNDYDDVRRIEEASYKGVVRALKSGSVCPLLIVQKMGFEKTDDLVALLGAHRALYVPIEVREDVPDRATKAVKLGMFCNSNDAGYIDGIIRKASAIESGRIVCRDIGGSDPERMAPPRVESYIRDTFKGIEGVTVHVESGHELFEKEYPCFAAVNRAAAGVPRHSGRIIWLTYNPAKEAVNKTAMLVGKGVTYDTGGADIKAGGVMAGMSRDKCGAASVAGFVKAVSQLKPNGLKVVAALAMVRNSVGNNCYVSDEIIVSRAGVRLRVGNTDAEGRMAMVDVLCRMKEKSLLESNPHLMTVATLTGHACIAMGPYTAIMDNGTAKAEGCSAKIQEIGELMADPFELSSIRREDYDFCCDTSGEFVDVIQCNNLPSSRTPRGHQFPAAFMIKVSGLDKHMPKCDKPLKYSHLDIAGSSGDLPGITTGSTVPALTAFFVGGIL